MSESNQPTIFSRGFFPKLFATFFFVGYLPKAPGTWASAITALFLYFVWPPQWYIQFPLIFVVYIFGVWAAGRAEQYFGHDARKIVIDEVAGQMTALFMAPHFVLAYILGFLFFRIFDIVKPPPARQWESLRGGYGVVADDIAAGFYAAIVLNILLAIFNKWGVTYF
ncbi:MAG TPA: phosphatidylglycerophosphatase A [candidate division Zixibacteria bacterium]|nr:phosphatidylglycerophosphatase A [candidate division Zixibacteria bacterium]HBZ01972.1 phosphatidylglycerophosphatase A [candidate division Zixibacteria bacterium]